MSGPSFEVMTLDAFAGLLETIMGCPIDRNLPLAEEGVDSLAVLDLLSLVEDRTGATWSIDQLESIDASASLADYYRLYVATVGRPVI